MKHVSHMVCLSMQRGGFSSLNALSQPDRVIYDDKHEVTYVAVFFALNLDDVW